MKNYSYNIHLKKSFLKEVNKNIIYIFVELLS